MSTAPGRTRTRRRSGAAVATSLLILLGLVAAVVLGVGYVGYRLWQRFDTSVGERCYLAVGDSYTTLTHEQTQNASIIVAATYKANLPEHAAIVGLATAWQESGLRNLDHGDADSLGLFQQRPSQGWGTEAEIQDPWYSSATFYAAMVKIDNWETRDVGEVAQAVQISAYPDAYDKHVENATALAAALRGSAPGTLSCIDRDTTTSDATAFADVVATVPGVTSQATDLSVTLTSDDETALWSATHLALAWTRPAGIESVVVGERAFNSEQKDWPWTTAKTPGVAGKATITLRG